VRPECESNVVANLFLLNSQPVVQLPDAPARFAAQLDNAQELNHLCVMLDGTTPFPEGYGCTIHLETPGKGWQLLGGCDPLLPSCSFTVLIESSTYSLTNAKPSAIFRLRNTFIPSASSLSSAFSTSSSSSVATLGISCEPLPDVEAQLASLASSAAATAANPANSTALVPASQGPDPVVLAQMVGKVRTPLYAVPGGEVRYTDRFLHSQNLFNTVAGFVQPLPDGSGSWINFKLIEQWYANFERKLKTQGVGFLLRQD
jgi:hypothetical protein